MTVGPDERNTHRIETARLVIDVPRRDEAARLFALVGGEDRRAICEHLIWDGPDHPSDIESWVDNCRRRTFSEWGFHWVIRDRGEVTGSEEAPIGAIGLGPPTVPGRTDIGYWLGRAHWRQGVMGEALTATLRYALAELGMEKIEAWVFTTNPAGLALVRSVGMRYEGTVRRAYRKYGGWRDTEVFGAVPGEI